MKKFRTYFSILIMFICGFAGMFLGAVLGDTTGGILAGILISGIACLIYTIDNRDS